MQVHWVLLTIAEFERCRTIIQREFFSLTGLSLLLALVTHMYPIQGLFR